jgi:Na+/melibiose symporter-like transporter
MRWLDRRERERREPLFERALLKNLQLRGGLLMFFFQYLVQAGVFFIVPLFLSVALGLSAIATGVRILPLSLSLLATAIGIPRLWPKVSPRRVVRLGLFALLAGAVSLIGGLTPSAGPEIVFIPMLLVGAGIGALASQLGAITVSAVPDDKSPQVGGLQNTMTNLGASLGTALAGSILIASLTGSFIGSIQQNPAIPDHVAQNAEVQLASGIPFVSDDQLKQALDDANVPGRQADAALTDYRNARLDGLRAALAVLALITLLALFMTTRVPDRQPGVT